MQINSKKKAVDALSDGDLLLLENTRFHPGEKANNPDFAAELADLAEVYANDAFGTAYRAHASTEGVAQYLPAAAGKLMARELTALEHIRNDPQQPLAMVFGGEKISDKIGVFKQFLGRTENLLVGGGIVNTFLKAQGLEVGASLVEEESLETAWHIMIAAVDKLVLPVLGLVKALAELQAETFSGGGEIAAAINQAGLRDQFAHISTGGGAFLKFLEGKELPAVTALDAIARKIAY